MFHHTSPTNFSATFLEKHHHLALYDLLHQIKAYILFPPNCGCMIECQCAALREKVVLSLNTIVFNKALKREEDLETIYTMKILLRIPEDSYFREHIEELYSPRMIKEDLEKKKQENHFKIINQLVWALLRLSQSTYSVYSSYEASLTKAIEFIIGNLPLKITNIRIKGHQRGEKVYTAYFHQYKAVCHFIAAAEWMKEEDRGDKDFLLTLEHSQEKIERFLKLCTFFRNRITQIETPNIKEKTLFLEGPPIPLPTWIQDDGIDLPIEPIPEVVDEIIKSIRGPFKSTEEAKADKLANATAAK